ncbi:MAG: dehydrogenase subunit [Humibacillus sp.]|nr:dehydrogenase subunit [Humibacillus sp.]
MLVRARTALREATRFVDTRGHGPFARGLTRLAVMSGYVAVAAVLASGVLLFLAAMTVRRLLAPRAPLAAKLTTYESGVDPVGSGWAQTTVRYFVFGFLYVIFAVDAIYLFPWALVLRDADLGRASLVEMGIFIAVIVLGLAHAGRRGLLRWV